MICSAINQQTNGELLPLRLQKTRPPQPEASAGDGKLFQLKLSAKVSENFSHVSSTHHRLGNSANTHLFG